MSQQPAVILDGVRKRFGNAQAIDGVTLQIPDGVPTALLGPSGCGKTTTLRAIAGLIEVDAGTITLHGQDVTDLRPYERDIGLVFQSYALFPHMTVEQNIQFGLKHRTGKRDARKVRDALELVGLQGLDDRKPRELSGGQQQRVALARALVTEPRVLLLDEPLSNLDARLRDHMRRELPKMFAEVNTTPIFVTHDQLDAFTLAELVVVMNAGRVMQVGPPGEIYDRPASRFVAEFVGDMNWFTGDCLGPRGPYWEYRVAGGVTFTVASPPPAGSQQCEIGIRPERVRVVKRQGIGGPDGLRHNLIEGVVEGSDRSGDSVTIDVRCNRDLLLRTRQSWLPEELSAPGAAVSTAVAPEDWVAIATHES